MFQGLVDSFLMGSTSAIYLASPLFSTTYLASLWLTRGTLCGIFCSKLLVQKNLQMSVWQLAPNLILTLCGFQLSLHYFVVQLHFGCP